MKIICISICITKLQKNIKLQLEREKAATAAGFEPTREFPNGCRVHTAACIQVHRLNHSAKQPLK
jgi:hypothetical protein